MNQPPLSSTPPFGDDTDEALSAFLDGELAAFAEDHGLTQATARAQLDAWPELEQRLELLERNRAAMQAPVAPLDDLTRRRLVRNALNELPAEAGSSKPSRPWAAITAVAAAALIAVAGIGVAISSTGGGNGSSDRASSGERADSAGPLRGDVGDLGDVTSPEALRTLLDRRAAAEAAGGGAENTSPGAPAASTTAPSDASDKAPSVPQTFSAAAVAACADQVAGDRPVTFTGTGQYKGQPVTIVGITEGGRTIVFVVASTDCTDVVASISR
jgi:hypothetical protein